MNYNDFPILSNEEYSLINEHFSNQQTDRKTQLVKICYELNSCKNSIPQLENKYNSKIATSIEKTHKLLIKVLNNLTSTFNLNETYSNSLYTLNIFSFLHKIINIASLLNVWSNTEQKTYYKSIAQKSCIELLESLKSLTKAMETSNVHFYKHM